MPQARKVVPDGGVRAGLNDGTGATIAKHRIVRRDTAVDSVQLTTAATQQAAGVTMEAIAENVTGDVQVAGKAIVEAGAAVAIGALITSDAVGRGVTAASTNFVIGTATTAAGALGDTFEVELATQPSVAP